MKTITKVNDGGSIINRIVYEPDGSSDLQKRITSVMHSIMLQTGVCTLGEIGYLHMNTVLYNRETQSIEVKIYFDRRLAMVTKDSGFNGATLIEPNKAFTLFRNYFYVGDLEDVVSLEKILGPKTEILKNEGGRPYLKIKNTNGTVETQAMVLNCSFQLTMAAVHNIDLRDPNFRVRCETMAKSGKHKDKQIVVMSNQIHCPVTITIDRSQDLENGHGYSPYDAIPYLTQLTREASKTKEKWKGAVEEIKKSAKKNKAKAEKKDKTSKMFNKYV